MGRRITRKQLKKDEFVSTMDRVVQWVSVNWRPIAAGLLGVFLLVLIWWGASSWSSGRADAASYLLYQGVSAYEEQLGAEAGEEQQAAAFAQLSEVVERYGRTDQADVARVYLARIHLARGDRNQARDLLVRVVEDHPDDAIGQLATLDLIDLRVASGQVAEVVQELEAAVTGPGGGLPRDVALFKLGELSVSSEQLDRAREYFQKLVDEFPESPYRAQARQRLTEIG
jgi:predicted negative regulator of RcsB-dependent stress response